MRFKPKFSHRLTSIFLAFTLLLSCLPLSLFTSADSESAKSLDTDISTMDLWKNYFPTGDNLTTENAGGVWTDKSVFTDAAAFSAYKDKNGNSVEMKGNDSFLVALSAIGSNMSVTGMSSVSTDTILVLDVSGSMGSGYNNVASELVDAANTSINTLLENPENRIGVVLYSDGATTLLELGRYKTTDTNDKFLSYSSGSITIDDNVTTEDGDPPYSGWRRPSREVSGGTYIQSGVLEAMDNFKNATIPDSQNVRKPVLVLMTDGAPTYGTHDFTTVGEDDTFGGGNSTTAGLGFVNQLTAAYAKNQIEAKYGNDCLFYTLGLAIGGGSSNMSKTEVAVATSVLNPENTDQSILDLWEDYDSLTVGRTLAVGTRNNRTRSVVKIEEKLDYKYVDRFFNSNDYEDTEGGLATALKKAFSEIVDDIIKHSVYTPTKIEENVDHSGYVTFNDRIGKYMDVTDMKGMVVGEDTFFSGAYFSSNLIDGGGELGTIDNPTPLGDELVWALRDRLGMPETLDASAQVRTLIGLAYQNEQLKFKSDYDFSNYIGWYANKNREYLGYWNEGTTTVPDPSDESFTDETRPYYLMKSYLFLGTVNNADISNLLYAIVNVSEEITTGEKMVSFGIPASLLPTITYYVTLDENSEPSEITTSDDVAPVRPIRLLYEVGLDSDINEFNFADKVSAEYIANNTDENGNIVFYSNQWEATTGYNTVNTYSYFRPNPLNDRYYFKNNSRIYSDEDTVYDSATHPKDAGIPLYRKLNVYEKNGNSYKTKVVYSQLSNEILEDAQKIEGTNTYEILSGCVRLNYEQYNVYKGGKTTEVPDDNITETLKYTNQPFIDVDHPHIDDAGHTYVVGATLGNNGRLTLDTETGIKISKKLSADATATDKEFSFEVNNADLSGTYPAYKVNADGTSSVTTVIFTNGKTTVNLKANEVLYIGGMAKDGTVTVTEAEDIDYIVSGITVDGTSADSVNITLSDGKLNDVAFTNADRGRGELTVAKEIKQPFGTEYQIPADKKFDFEIKLEGVATKNRTDLSASITHSDNTVDDNITLTTDQNGNIQEQIKLAHNEQLRIKDLPAGIKATVKEVNVPDNFTSVIWEGTSENADGVVTIEKGQSASVIVVNTYKQTANAKPINIEVEGTKSLSGRDWLSTDEFKFQLQKWDTSLATPDWVMIAETSVSGQDASAPDAKLAFDFNNVFDNGEYETFGTFYYRVVEVSGAVGGISYDRTVHSFAVEVSDIDLDGKLDIKEVRSTRTTVTSPANEGDDWIVTTNFNNTYSTIGTATASVEITKNIINESGSSLASLEGFEFGLFKDGETTPSYITNGTNLRGFTRLNILFEASQYDTYPQTFEYTLKEIKETRTGWKYSNAEIPVTVKLYDDGDGSISAKIFATADGETGATDVMTAQFTNTYDPADASISIAFADKVLTGRELNAGEFSFGIYEITDTDYSDPVRTGVNTADTDKDGKAVIDFGAPLTYSKVGNYFYNVKEITANGNGITVDPKVFQVTVNVYDNNGTLDADYTIVNGEDRAVFTNTYVAKDVDYTFKAQKNLAGRKLVNDEFTFVLTKALDAEGNTVQTPETFTATNKLEGEITFPAITYTNAGTYYYTLHEVKPAGSTFGLKYDETVYIITQEVYDDGVGNLVARNPVITVKGNGASNSLVFNNSYTAAAVKYAISGEKILDNKTITDGQFEFTLYESNSTWTKELELETVSNVGRDFKFSQKTYTSVGTHYYIVKEKNAGQTINGITYDDTVYRVTLNITDNLRGNLVATPSYTDGFGIPDVMVKFVNTYEVTENANITLSGEKKLTGREMIDGEFTFELYKTESDYVVAEGATPEKTPTNQNKRFSVDLEYTPDQIGQTFYYVLKEKNAGDTVKGVKYDNKEYKIEVKVSDNGDGKVKTDVKINGGTSVGLAQLDFSNTYTAKATKISFNGKKFLDGARAIKKNDFKFDIYEANSSYSYSGSYLKTDNNDADGNFSFNDIELNSAKVYYFVIKENSRQSISGVTYDKSSYNISVTVKDDGEGNLYVDNNLTTMTHVISATESEPATKIEFRNSYDSEDTTLNIKGKKYLKNRDLEVGEFKFILQEKTNNDFTDNIGDPSYALNKANGEFIFDAITYSAEGTHYYTVTEDNTVNVERVSFDPKVYYVTVTVTDTDEAKLKTEVKISDGVTDNIEKIEFINTFTPKPDDIYVDFGIGKKVENKGTDKITAEGFEFKLEINGNKAADNVKTDKTGKAKFTLKFTEDDIGETYTYKLSEVDGKRANVKYSTAVYTITVKITLGEDNKLVATVTQDEKAVEIVNAEFVNEYDYSPPVEEQKESPVTGNSGSLTFWFALLFVSFGGVITTAIYGKRKLKNK